MISRFARDEYWLDRSGARAAYLELIGKAVASTDVAILGYCLMSNHVHLVVVQGEASLERFVKSVHTGFARWVQSEVGRRGRGPVFAGRPRMLLVEEEPYLLELIRYVHNNPVRAKAARFARTSPWSSHRSYIGRETPPGWLQVGYVLGKFGKDVREAVTRFDAFVDEGRRQERRPELSGAQNSTEAAAVRRALGDGHRVSDGILGSARFTAKVRADAEHVAAALSRRGAQRRSGPAGRPSVRELIDAVLAWLEVDPVELEIRPRSRASARAKRLATWMWVHEYCGKQADIARALCVDTGTVSRYYGQAARAAGEYDQQATAIKALLTKRRSRARRSHHITPAAADSLPVRYHVDVNET